MISLWQITTKLASCRNTPPWWLSVCSQWFIHEIFHIFRFLLLKGFKFKLVVVTFHYLLCAWQLQLLSESISLDMPIEVRPKSKHPGMMKKARGGERFDALDSESLMPPALRWYFRQFSVICWNSPQCISRQHETLVWTYEQLVKSVLSYLNFNNMVVMLYLFATDYILCFVHASIIYIHFVWLAIENIFFCKTIFTFESSLHLQTKVWEGHTVSKFKVGISVIILICFANDTNIFCRSRLYDLFGQIEREFEMLFADNLACKLRSVLLNITRFIWNDISLKLGSVSTAGNWQPIAMDRLPAVRYDWLSCGTTEQQATEDKTYLCYQDGIGLCAMSNMAIGFPLFQNWKLS